MFKSLLKKASSKVKSPSNDRSPAPFMAPRPPKAKSQTKPALPKPINTDPANFDDFGVPRQLAHSTEWELCEQCNPLGNFIANCVKFQQWPTGYQGDANTFDIGFLDTLLATRACRLCRLIGTALRESFTSPPGPTEFGDGKKRRLRVIIDTAYLYMKEGVFDNIDLAIILWQHPGVKYEFHQIIRSRKFNEMEVFAPSVRVLDEDLKQLPVRMRAGGISKRIGHGKCEVERICGDYKTCVSEHGTACEVRMHDTTAGDEEFVSKVETVEGLLMLDTRDMCVVEAPKGCRYVALSYVWGKTRVLLLERENRHVLETPGALENDGIPRTVREAISLTRQLGERYLWVDALCIVQNDDELKLPQIKRMDEIYLNAALTIVATDGDHANTGLTGYSPNSRVYRQNVEIIGGLKFASIPVPLPNKVAAMKWYSRAWTYQEFMMSKRMLLFTAEQIIYVCRKGGYHEGSTHKEIEAPSSDNDQDTKCLFSPDRNIGSWHQQTRNLQLDWAHFIAHRTVVQSVTAREMTNEADILRSTLGILKILSKLTSEKYICGMPASNLELALHWQPVGELQRRGRTYDGGEFASWSWIGWSGDVKYLGFHEGVLSALKPRVRDWQLLTPNAVSKTGYAQLYLDEHRIERAAEYHNTVWLPRDDPASAADRQEMSDMGILEHQSQTETQLPLLERGILKFTAQSATYFVETCQTTHPNQTEDISHPIWRIIDPQTFHWVGTLFLGASNDYLSSSVANHVQIELIAIANSKESFETPNQSRANGRLVKLAPYDVKAPLGSYKYGDFHLVNVMWIIWESRTELNRTDWFKSPIARRMGVGQIHISSWQENAKMTKTVLLG